MEMHSRTLLAGPGPKRLTGRKICLGEELNPVNGVETKKSTIGVPSKSSMLRLQMTDITHILLNVCFMFC